MSKPYVTLLGKAVRTIARIRGGGSALPGLFVEKIDPDFIRRTLHQLPQGVIIVSGTNGKTTTTKMVVALLESQNLRVFTNRTGSNFTRGVAAALLGEVDTKGNIDADIAVLELDEAHAVHFVQTVAPRFSLLLNVMRDQLDRFGEIDTTAKMLTQIAEKTTEAVVLNREDTRIAAIAAKLPADKVHFFGLAPQLTHLFPNDDDMRTAMANRPSALQQPDAGVILQGIKDDKAQFLLEGSPVTTTLKLQGIYNVYNAAAALALARLVLPAEHDKSKLIEALSQVTPAFGRGETLIVNGQPFEIVLVKNPSGFRLSLASFKPHGYQTMIAINDNYADGRDMSWLWDVDFDSLLNQGVSLVTGIRAYDMALRLQYDDIAVAAVEKDIAKALKQFVLNDKDTPKRVFCTYTAMLTIRKELSKVTKVENIS